MGIFSGQSEYRFILCVQITWLKNGFSSCGKQRFVIQSGSRIPSSVFKLNHTCRIGSILVKRIAENIWVDGMDLHVDVRTKENVMRYLRER